MIKKKWMLNGLYLIITIITFSLSVCRIDSSVWIAAWIAPIFLIRFVRDNKWIFALIAGFITLQIAVIIGASPLFTMMTESKSSLKMDFGFILIWQVKSGLLLLAPLLLAPFILDKALYNRLPKLMASLIYPLGVVTIEFLKSLTTGASQTFGVTQFHLPPLVMSTSIFGVFGLSFIITWTASMINYLWEEKWNIKNLGYSGLIYATIMAGILVYSAIAISFPVKAEKNVPIAGITLNHNIFERITGFNGTITEVLNLNSDEYSRITSSPQSHLKEMRQKTLEAIEAGAKIIVWQETPLALESSVADTYLNEMKILADENNVYLLVSYERLLNEIEKKDELMKNVGVLFTPEGDMSWEYVKAFPVPGLEERFSEAGSRDIPYLDTPYGRIGQVICADMMLPHYIKQAAEKNIDLLFVPSLDAVAYTPLFAFSSSYRAVENGFTMVRITGDGYSTVIDPYYRIWAGQNSYEQGTTNLYVNVPVVSRKTFYANIGFIFPYIIIFSLVLLIALAIIHPDKKKQKAN